MDRISIFFWNFFHCTCNDYKALARSLEALSSEWGASGKGEVALQKLNLFFAAGAANSGW
jgi:hypothetical protein